MLKGLKEKKGNRILEKKLHNFKRNVVFHNIENTKMLGIIYKYESKHSADYITKLFQEFSSYGIKCTALGYYDDKTLPLEYAPKQSSTVISQADLTWSKIPKSEEVDKFVQIEFDILLDLSRSSELVFKYVASLSKAQFKIGGVRYEKDPYDLVFIEETHSDQLFVDQVLQFIQSIKIG